MAEMVSLAAEPGDPMEPGDVARAALLLLAGDDRIVSRPASESFARSLTGDVTVRVYEGFYHEVFNEPHRARVFRDVEPWLDRVLSGAAPPAAAPAS